MTAEESRPWLTSYPADQPAAIAAQFGSMIDLFAATATRRPGATAIAYFDGTLSFGDLDDRSDALACALLGDGFQQGDRLAIYTQNNPAFVIGLLAAWKAGGIAVPINPMNRVREVNHLLTDSGAVALLCLDELYDSVVRDVLGAGHTDISTVLVADAHDDQTRDDPRVLHSGESPSVDAPRLNDVIAAHRGSRPPRALAAPTDPAVLTYTSGTTGKPKGAINTHGALAFNSQTYREWMRLDGTDVILGIAPLFHITGLVGHITTSMLTGAKLVLLHRFDGSVVLDAIREHRPTFTVGAITAFTNIASQPGTAPEDFASLRTVYSGGAPISPRMRDDIEERTGIAIHNIYGMTETTSPTHAVPLGSRAPVDPTTGALSIGVPVYNTTARIIDDDGVPLAPGEIGELAVSGPQVTPGYWNQPEQTAERIVEGELRTGDVGIMDEDGWFYLIDRKSDVIIASGYKVWPREVEDVLTSHPGVREAAVVGVEDSYRGETVKAVVVREPGTEVTVDELIAYCKGQLAAYKYPRLIDVVEALPRNAAGKVLRRELR